MLSMPKIGRGDERGPHPATRPRILEATWFTVWGSGFIYGILRVILGLNRDNGKEKGSYYLGFRV